MSSRFFVHTILEWVTPSCVCLFICACYYQKNMSKGNDTDYTKHLNHSVAKHSTHMHFCFARNLLASLVEVTHQCTPLIQDIHDTVSWYHWCHMIQCHDTIDVTWLFVTSMFTIHMLIYNSFIFCLSGLCVYVFVCRFSTQEDKNQEKCHARILQYYLKAPFSQPMLYLWCDLLTSMAVVSNQEYRKEQLAHSRLLVNITVQSVQ